MKKTFYYIDEKKIKSDFINSEEYASKEEAERHFNWLKSVEKHAKNGNDRKVYSLLSWTVEIDEDGDPLENANGSWNCLDEFITERML